MANKFNFNLNKNNIFEVGNRLFLLGVLFLPSALPISGILLLPSLFISFIKKNYQILNDKFNYSLFLAIGIIIFSTFNISFLNRDILLDDYDLSLIWINLFNWLPIFICFWGFQIYLKSYEQRILFSKYLIVGSIPVFVSFILHNFFKIYGPFKTLFGSIVWYLKAPISTKVANSPIAGLFSNPNYASMWLVLIFPFCIFLLNKYKKNSIKAIVLFFICLSVIYFIFLTGSRNGILGIAILIFFIYSFKKFFIFFSGFISFLYLPKFIQYIFNNDNSIYFVNQKYFLNFTFITPRIDIWRSALSRIQERPLWGWGGSTFPFLHIKYNNFAVPREIINAQHSHNIVLELAHNFGIPLAIILSITLVIFLYKAWKIIFFQYELNQEILLEKIWFTSVIIFLFSHLTDITFYDGKINILVSILFAGLKCILNQKKIKKEKLSIN